MKKLYSVRTIILAGGLLLQLNTLCFHSRGAAGDADLSFDPRLGVDGRVNAVAVQPDGKVIIGGGFTTVKGLVRPGLARLNADGSGDSSFNPGAGANAAVRQIALQPDGRVLIGGDFYWDNGTFRNNVARLQADGSLDSSFNPDLPPGVDISGAYDGSTATAAFALQPDGKVLVVGVSTQLDICGDANCGPSFSYFVIRLNPNGSRDTSFDPTLGDHFLSVEETMDTVAVQPDGKVLVGGTFRGIKGTNRNGIARLNADESLDGSFNPVTGVSGGSVSSIAVQSDGKVLVGGYFTTVNGTNRNNMARLNADGSLDGSFKPGTGANQTVLSIALQSDGKALIGGYLNSVNGVRSPYVARLYAIPRLP